MVVRVFAPEAEPCVFYHRRRSTRYSEGDRTSFIHDGRLDIRRSPVYSEKVVSVFVDNPAGERVLHMDRWRLTGTRTDAAPCSAVAGARGLDPGGVVPAGSGN